jgi:hypothetical protein
MQLDVPWKTIISEPIKLLNPIDFHTYIDRRTGNPGCLDLLLVSSDISPCFSISRLSDVGSDHFPLLATSQLSLMHLDSMPVPQWKIDTEGLKKFASQIGPLL